MYLVCSRCRVPVDLPVWPTHELLQGLHFNLYIPLEFTLFSGTISRSWLYMVLLVRKAIFKLVFLNKLVTFLRVDWDMWRWPIFPFVVFVWVWLSFFFVCVFSIIFFLNLWIIYNGKPLFLATVRIMFHSCCFLVPWLGALSSCLHRNCTQYVYVLTDGWMWVVQ